MPVFKQRGATHHAAKGDQQLTEGDFEFDRESFSDFLERRDHSARVAIRDLWTLMGRWPALASSMLGGRAEIDVGEIGDRVTGKVLGKSFFIDAAPMSCETCVMTEVLVSAPALGGGCNVEICRFLVAPDGSILSNDSNSTLHQVQESYVYENDMQLDEDLRSYDVLIAVLRKVMSAPLTI